VALSETPVQANCVCFMPKQGELSQQSEPLCDSYIPSGQQLQINGPARYQEPVSAQEGCLWCWAATAQAIFRYYGYDVSQAEIVRKGYGRYVVFNRFGQPRGDLPGLPRVMLKALNATYIDRDGRLFRVTTPKYYDVFSLLNRDVATACYQSGLTIDEIIQELREERPVFYATRTHAMVLVGIRHTLDETPRGYEVLDPAPDTTSPETQAMLRQFGGSPAEFSPWCPSCGLSHGLHLPALGYRWLNQPESYGYFAAAVAVSEVE